MLTAEQKREAAAWTRLGKALTTTVVHAFYSGWLLMLLLGIVAGEFGVPTAIGYWPCVLLALCARPIYLGTTYRVTKTDPT